MKKITLIVMLIAFGTFAIAQPKKNTQVDINGTHITPTTSIVVELVVKRESVVKGPYSRYATQLLGVVAPLNDKVSYSIEAVNISGSQVGAMSNIAKKGNKQKAGFKKGDLAIGNSFLDMSLTPIFSEATGEKNLKTMASEAASTIFKLRSRRFDIVTGETGENVFGAGLQAALDEMARIEKEYLELFVGKQSVEYLTYQYEIIPEQKKLNYMVCRFDPTMGVIDGMNITGTPIVLTTIDENRVIANNTVQQKKGSVGTTNKVMIAYIALCKLTLGEELLAERRISIFQFGEVGEKITNNNEATK